MVIRPHIWDLRHLPEICSPETFMTFYFLRFFSVHGASQPLFWLFEMAVLAVWEV